MSLSSAIFLAAAALSQGGPLDGFELQTSTEADALLALGTGAHAHESVLSDVTLSLEAETITDSGLRYGVAGSVRAQRDSGRRGVSRQVGDCPPFLADCPAANSRGLAGALTGLHGVPGALREPVQAELASAYLFVKTRLFETRIGRGPGAGVLEAEPLPGAFRLARADGSLVDPEGLALVATGNSLSTNAAKILVRSRRLAGFRAAASYTPRADACGVDVCRPETRANGPVFSEVDHVVEAAVSFDHLFRASGQRWTVSATASRGEADGAFASAFVDPWAASARVIWTKGPLSAGLGALASNDGVDDGAYRAVSASLSYERGAWLTAAEWAGADSDLVHARGWTAQIGASRLFESGAVAGFGLRHGEERVPAPHGTARRADTRAASTIFVEAGLRF